MVTAGTGSAGGHVAWGGGGTSPLALSSGGGWFCGALAGAAVTGASEVGLRVFAARPGSV